MKHEPCRAICMKTSVTLELIVDGSADAVESAVCLVLHAGVLQDAINDVSPDSSSVQVESARLIRLKELKTDP